MIKISIIIPCFNELATISKIIDKILEIKIFNFEIIVIDDFSSDRSREILKKLSEKKIQNLILNEKNYGKGYSIRQGIKPSPLHYTSSKKIKRKVQLDFTSQEVSKHIYIYILFIFYFIYYKLIINPM